MVKAVRDDATVRKSVSLVLEELLDGKSSQEPLPKSFDEGIEEQFKAWVVANTITDKRFQL